MLCHPITQAYFLHMYSIKGISSIKRWTSSLFIPNILLVISVLHSSIHLHQEKNIFSNMSFQFFLVEAECTPYFPPLNLPLTQAYPLCLCVFRYMSIAVVDEKTDCVLLALACSDAAVRSVSVI